MSHFLGKPEFVLLADAPNYVPHGLESEFPSRYSNVIGMDWYTQDTIGDLTIHFLPANHGSGIYSHEQNQTLWGGWLFEWNDYRIYFAGVTGYSAVFKDINSRVGEVDICLMPIALNQYVIGFLELSMIVPAVREC